MARTTAPLVTDLVLEGEGVIEVAPRALPDLYAEAPALVTARLAAGGGEVILRGRTAEGTFEQRFSVPALEQGEGPASVAALFGREKVEDLETALSAGGDAVELNSSVEATGIEFQIASRLTSWIAVSPRVTVTPGAERLEVEQPHELPHGVSVEGLGLRGPAGGKQGLLTRACVAAPAAAHLPRATRRRSFASKHAEPSFGEARKLELEEDSDLEVVGGFDGSRRPLTGGGPLPAQPDRGLTREGVLLDPEAIEAYKAAQQRQRPVGRQPRSKLRWLVLALILGLILALTLWLGGAFGAAPSAGSGEAPEPNSSPQGVGPR